MDINRTDDSPVRVAVLDTGIDSSHPEFVNETKDDGRIKDWKGFPFDPLHDKRGHGTYVASVILRSAPRTALYIARVSDDSGKLDAANDYEAAANVPNLSIALLTSKGD